MLLSVGLLIGGTSAAWAADAKPEKKPAAAKPADAKPADAKTDDAKTDAKEEKPEPKVSAAGVKLVKPWSELASLTDEQKVKIEAIHKKALAESSAIDKKEKEDIMAVLNDAQKTELKELSGKKKKEAAEKKTDDKKPDDKKTEEKSAK